MKLFKQDKHLLMGLILIIISSITYTLEVFYFENSNELFTFMFMIHYGIAIMFYFIASIACKEINIRSLFSKRGLSSYILLLVLFNISAYSLNQSITVFNESENWLVVFLIVENTVLVALAMLKKHSRIVTLLAAFFSSIALSFNIYQTLMVLPVAPIGMIGALFLGISLLLFVPIFYIYGLIAILRSFTWTKAHTYAFSVGLFLCIAVITFYVVQLKKIESSLLNKSLTIDAPYHELDLPDWVPMAQQLNENPFTEYYLKSGLVYQNFTNYREGFSSIIRSSLTEKYIHDPLISISSIFIKRKAIDDQTKIKVLNYLYNSRHQSAERFWSGENLKSEQIVTNVEIFPNERLTFSELIITINNHRPDKKSWWRRQQEAFYTFQLPEGGVVTSLSLWIGGTEAKGILTSKKKAEKAYNTIVGKERRDPSVVYWMEGNQVRVRVFPCTPDENRKFKVGVTAPLKKKGRNLIYDPITFVGPDYSNAKSAINIVAHEAEFVTSSIEFEKEELFYAWQGNYQPDWNFSIKSRPIDLNSFSFGNESFNVIETQSELKAYDPEMVYLDVSSKWTQEELRKITKMISNNSLSIFSTSMRQIETNETIDLNIPDLPSFTLFPFHKIKSNKKAIVITKGDTSTPNLTDLDKTNFKEHLFNYFENQIEAILVVDIGQDPSDYMRSLKEFGVIDYQKLNIETLKNCFEKKEFPTLDKTPNTIHIPQSEISIVKSENSSKNKNHGSDHLMRLFYYQDLMKSIGNKYFSDTKNSYLEDSLVEKSSVANVVTPLSSLVVLETQQDYDRFGIMQNKDSLGNAAINNSGAVPEPHEWALIIIGIGVLFFMYWKSKTQSSKV